VRPKHQAKFDSPEYHEEKEGRDERKFDRGSAAFTQGSSLRLAPSASDMSPQNHGLRIGTSRTKVYTLGKSGSDWPTQQSIDRKILWPTSRARRDVVKNTAMRIALGSDHAGFELKAHLLGFLGSAGHETLDLGTNSTESVDYPAFCAAFGRAVVAGEADWGIVIGGSGQGEQLAANKVHGVRAALCNDLYTARMARAHNDANVLSIGGRVVGIGLAEEIVELFAETDFEGGRHQRRVDQVMEIEQNQC